MPSNKNQHYVPRCCLKPFSLNAEGHCINLYNFRRGKFVENAPAKSQCSGDYFYSKDVSIEKILQIPEGFYAKFLAEVGNDGFRFLGESAKFLKEFTYLQFCRTEQQARKAKAMMTDAASAFFKDKFPLEIDEALKASAMMAIKAFSETLDIIDDLKIVLLVNKSQHSIFTSDDPAVLLNKWYHLSRIAQGYSFGVGNSGAIIIFPLSPRLACLLYDGDVYSVPNSFKIIELRKTSDVTAINTIQALNAMENVYFSDWTDQAYVQQIANSISGRRVLNRQRVTYAVLDREDEWGQTFSVIEKERIMPGQDALIHHETLPIIPPE